MKYLRQWIKDCIWKALEDKRQDIMHWRPPTDRDDFAYGSTWDAQGKKWIAVNRKTQWEETNG